MANAPESADEETTILYDYPAMLLVACETATFVDENGDAADFYNLMITGSNDQVSINQVSIVGSPADVIEFATRLLDVARNPIPT